jgi:hypothetical protein
LARQQELHAASVANYESVLHVMVEFGWMQLDNSDAEAANLWVNLGHVHVAV